MKKSYQMLTAAIIATGLCGTAIAAPDVTIRCGDDVNEVEDCDGTNLWEISLKCEGVWRGRLEVDTGADFDLIGQNWEDGAGEVETCDMNGALDSTKTEVKCQRDDGTKKGGDKIEAEMKNKGEDLVACPPPG